MQIKCDVYKCDRKAETYLYLKSDIELVDLPDTLKSLLGELTQFLSLKLSPDSKLAQVAVRDVLAALNDQGYYLQMPPAERLKTQTPGSGFVQ